MLDGLREYRARLEHVPPELTASGQQNLSRSNKPFEGCPDNRRARIFCPPKRRIWGVA